MVVKVQPYGCTEAIRPVASFVPEVIQREYRISNAGEQVI